MKSIINTNSSSANNRYLLSVRFILRYTPDKVLYSSIYVRTTVNGNRAPEKSLGIKVKKSDWSPNEQCLISRNEDSALINARLTKVKSEFDKAYFQLLQSNETITARKVQLIALGIKPESNTLNFAFETFLNEKKITSNLSPRTLQAYTRYFNNVKKFLDSIGCSNMLLSDVTEKTLLDLLQWLKKSYCQDYSVKNAQFFRSIFTYAVSKGLVNQNPLITIRLEKSGFYDTSHLTQSQVKELVNFDFYSLTIENELKRLLSEERDAFIFTCYTGLHHADYQRAEFTLKELNGRTWLHGFRVKSKSNRKDKPYSMPLHPLALDVISRYGSIYNLPKRGNSKRNMLLKVIAAYVGLEIRLTTKIARKTLADYCLNELQMRQETVASVLGHTSTNYIKHYAKISNKSIDEEMKFED